MNGGARVAALLGMLALAACTLPRPAGEGAANETAATVAAPTAAQLLATVQRAADGIDQSGDAAARARLLATASASAQQCLARFADAAACHYAQAQVLGLMAREHPVQAVALLKEMLASLARAEALDPELDHAGPARLTAVVLLRAPPWPLGPGDVDAAMVAAQRAVQRAPAYPPNLITLAQVQAKTEGAKQGRATFTKAQQAVQAWTGTPTEAPDEVAAERAGWQQTVAQGLQALQ